MAPRRKRAQPTRIGKINRVTTDISIPVHAVRIPQQVGLQEPAERWGVHPGLVIIHAEFRYPRLASIAEPAQICRGGDAIFVILVRRDARACAVAHRDDAPAFIGVEEALVRRASTFIPDYWLVLSGTVNIPPRHAVARPAPLGDHLIPNIIKAARLRTLVHRTQPALR